MKKYCSCKPGPMKKKGWNCRTSQTCHTQLHMFVRKSDINNQMGFLEDIYSQLHTTNHKSQPLLPTYKIINTSKSKTIFLHSIYIFTNMATFNDIKLLFLALLIFCKIAEVYSRGPVYTPPSVERLTDRFSRIPINKSYDYAFGASHIHVKNNGTSADLTLDKSSGSGLLSRNRYYYGFFNAAMKLPAGFTSGVVVAFYLSNADVFPHNHDEIDIELLGHEKLRDWVLQTNIYGNGSVRSGREEKFYLWFDPTLNFHDYTILWNSHHILFLVDNIPVREVAHSSALGSVYPSKAMSVYATIWDGSEWATHGGKYAVDYKFAPFVASVRGVEMEGCVLNRNDTIPWCSRSNVSSLDPVGGEQFSKLSSQQLTALAWARRKHMFYSYCQDTNRYKLIPPECNPN